MSKRDFITDAEVEDEIEDLKNSEYVKLAKAEQQIKYKRRQYLYKLRNLEKRGKALAEQGYSLDEIKSGSEVFL